MAIETLKSKLIELRDKATAIETQQGENQWTEEALSSYKSIVAEAEKVRDQLDVEIRSNAVKQWMEGSAGSTVKSTFRPAGYAEGAADGLTQDHDGELTAFKAVGEQRLSALKSGDYKDAFAQHMRQKAILGADWRAGMKGDALKVLQAGADESGGFWIPPDYRSELIKKAATMTTVRQNATIITTGSDIVTFPSVKYTTDQKYTSGVRFAWNGDAPSSNISEATNPVAGRLNIPINVATAALFVSRSMMEDNSFDILGYCSELLAEAFGLGEEDAFWNSVGDGNPQGITTHPMASVAHGTQDGMYVLSGAAGTLTWGASATPTTAVTKGILGLEAALPPQYETNAKWYANKKTYSSIRALSDTQSRPLWQTTDAPGLTNYVRGLPATLLGYDIQKTQFLPDLEASSLSVAFGDMKGYVIADRVGLSIEVFREVLGLRDLVVLYARKRVGGALLQPWRMKLMKTAES